MALEVKRRRGDARYGQRDRIEAKRLLRRPPGQRHPREGRHGRRSLAEAGVDLVDHSSEHLGGGEEQVDQIRVAPGARRLAAMVGDDLSEEAEHPHPRGQIRRPEAAIAG